MASSASGADALFVFIGADAETAWLPTVLERDEWGYLRTGRDIEAWCEKRPPFPLETSMTVIGEVERTCNPRRP